ncbi:hypothetical protein SAMN05444266_111106 [Chitinophaga jiangningensis]|uniref:Uncharacterized protein n=1 Tax=Chitinophaga jiangningensis TaxID=1419482 RepID=A0A1M7LRH0_9BACT|nr:hypothetical protein [Chitinophaga jiangningensis]SHM80880.1 hypothetical protein SAMN05444266_111106 [Chitinophaga jiangningensis]
MKSKKSLAKLNAKKVESLDAIKGGLMQLSNDLSADLGESAAGTTVHTPTHYEGPDVYICDHKKDK